MQHFKEVQRHLVQIPKMSVLSKNVSALSLQTSSSDAERTVVVTSDCS